MALCKICKTRNISDNPSPVVEIVRDIQARAPAPNVYTECLIKTYKIVMCAGCGISLVSSITHDRLEILDDCKITTETPR